MKRIRNHLVIVFLMFFLANLSGQGPINRVGWWSPEEKQRTLEGIVLSKTDEGYIKRDYQLGTSWHEPYPGILYIRENACTDCVELRFYNKNKELQKVLTPGALNPFWKKMDLPISKGVYNHDYHRLPTEKEQEIGLQPTQYLTFPSGVHTDMINGYTIASYSLTTFHDNVLLSQESVIIIIDPYGNVKHSLLVDDQINGVHLSDDGSLIAFGYGSIVYNPTTKCTHGECRVYDFKKDRVVLKIQAGNDKWIRTLALSKQERLVSVGYAKLDSSNDSTYHIDLIDLNKRKRYYNGFNKSELAEKWERYGSYRAMIEYEELIIDSF